MNEKKSNKKNTNTENINISTEDLKKLLENAVDATFKGRFEVINYKLDAIETQTTRTNGRVTDLEGKVDELERDGIRRLNTCPQKETFEMIGNQIDGLKEKTIESRTIENLILKTVTIAGIFFTILFGLIFGILRVLGDTGLFTN